MTGALLLLSACQAILFHPAYVPLTDVSVEGRLCKHASVGVSETKKHTTHSQVFFQYLDLCYCIRQLSAFPLYHLLRSIFYESFTRKLLLYGAFKTFGVI